MILLSEDITVGAILMIIFGFIIVVGVLSGFVSRVTGTKAVPKTSLFGSNHDQLQSRAINQHQENLRILNEMDTEIVQQAVKNIQNSIYANTSDNILREAKKLQKIKQYGTIENRIKNKLDEVKSNLSIKSKTDFDNLEKLYSLKERGIITEEEFEIQKRKILK